MLFQFNYLIHNKIDSKLQDTAWYNDCYYKKKQMGAVMQRNKNDGKDFNSVADSDAILLNG